MLAGSYREQKLRGREGMMDNARNGTVVAESASKIPANAAEGWLLDEIANCVLFSRSLGGIADQTRPILRV